jgi:hypothetical protein
MMIRREPSPFLPEDAPADPQDARRSNRNRVLSSIITRGPATRAELSRRVGLSRPTISVIANELLDRGLLSEGERVSSGGAPGVLLEMSKDTGVTLTADLRDPASVRIATVSVNGGVVAQRTLAAPTTRDVVDGIADFARGMEPGALIGAALAVPGWVDPRGEWQHNPAHGIDTDVVTILRRRLRLPVFAMNSTDATAIADLRDSRPDLTGQMTFATNVRIGAGIILGGRLRTGVRRAVGELAHTVPGTPGPVCAECGHRCLQEQVRPLHRDRGPDTRRMAVDAMACVIAPIAAAMEVEEVVLAEVPEGIAEGIAQMTHEGLAHRMQADQVPAVRVSRRGPDAPLIGAAAMMLYRRLG